MNRLPAALLICTPPVAAGEPRGYWSGTAGTFQVVTFTGQNLFDEMAADFTGLLNSVVVTKN